MTSYRAPDFHERNALSRQAKQKALEKLRAKPAPTEAELAERKAARLAREAEQAEARRLKREAAEKEKAERLAAAQEAAAQAAAAKAKVAPVRTEAEKKAERDARYAARKARK